MLGNNFLNIICYWESASNTIHFFIWIDQNPLYLTKPHLIYQIEQKIMEIHIRHLQPSPERKTRLLQNRHANYTRFEILLLSGWRFCTLQDLRSCERSKIGRRLTVLLEKNGQKALKSSMFLWLRYFCLI